MIVIDTSVIVDSLLPKLEIRNKTAKEFLKSVQNLGIKVYEPKVLKIELVGVLSRVKEDKIVKDLAEEIFSEIIPISEEEIFDIAFDVALKTKCRAIDSYFIATAKLTNSILITNDKIMNENAKKYGIESYYLIDEFEKVEKRIKEMK